MLPIQNLASGVLAEIIRRQPASKERTAFAWQIAVGPALARVTTVELTDCVLHVRSRDARWAHEVRRANDVIVQRLQNLLGRDAITRIALEE